MLLCRLDDRACRDHLNVMPCPFRRTAMAPGVIATIVQVEPTDIQQPTIEHRHFLVVGRRVKIDQLNREAEAAIVAFVANAAQPRRLGPEPRPFITVHFQPGAVEFSHLLPDERVEHQFRYQPGARIMQGYGEFQLCVVPGQLLHGHHLALGLPCQLVQFGGGDRVEIRHDDAYGDPAVESREHKVEPRIAKFPGFVGMKLGRQVEQPEAG